MNKNHYFFIWLFLFEKMESLFAAQIVASSEEDVPLSHFVFFGFCFRRCGCLWLIRSIGQLGLLQMPSLLQRSRVLRSLFFSHRMFLR